MKYAIVLIDEETKLEEYRSYIQFWYSETATDENGKFYLKRNYLVQEQFSRKSDVGLGAGMCEEAKGDVYINTGQLKHFMQASIQGPLLGNESYEDKYCYAYAFNPIEFEYDYGDPPCEMSVSDVILRVSTFNFIFV